MCRGCTLHHLLAVDLNPIFGEVSCKVGSDSWTIYLQLLNICIKVLGARETEREGGGGHTHARARTHIDDEGVSWAGRGWNERGSPGCREQRNEGN